MQELLNYNNRLVDLSNIDLPNQLIYPKITTEQPNNLALNFEVNQGKITVFLRDDSIKQFGWDNFVITKAGVLKIGKYHYALAETQAVVGAGSFLHKGGSIVAIANTSGHYQPTTIEALRSYRYLQEKLGIDLSNALDHTIEPTSNATFEQEESVLRIAWTRQFMVWQKQSKK